MSRRIHRDLALTLWAYQEIFRKGSSEPFYGLYEVLRDPRPRSFAVEYIRPDLLRAVIVRGTETPGDPLLFSPILWSKLLTPPVPEENQRARSGKATLLDGPLREWFQKHKHCRREGALLFLRRGASRSPRVRGGHCVDLQLVCTCNSLDRRFLWSYVWADGRVSWQPPEGEGADPVQQARRHQRRPPGRRRLTMRLSEAPSTRLVSLSLSPEQLRERFPVLLRHPVTGRVLRCRRRLMGEIWMPDVEREAAASGDDEEGLFHEGVLYPDVEAILQYEVITEEDLQRGFNKPEEPATEEGLSLLERLGAQEDLV